MADSIGVSQVIKPHHMVAVKLNTFDSVGTAIRTLEYRRSKWPQMIGSEKNYWSVWAHATKDLISLLCNFVRQHLIGAVIGPQTQN